MIIKDAKAAARDWVMQEAARIPGFHGAFFHGSVNWLLDDDELPATSDLDIMVVLDDAELQQKLGKFDCGGVLLEVSYLPRAQLGSAEQVLGQYHLAGSFHIPSVIADPTGELTVLNDAVAREYAKRRWVETRCANARDKIVAGLELVPTFSLFPEQVNACLFATGVTTHVLLVAGRWNPTVRKRYVAVRELLDTYDLLEFHEGLLALMGCAHMSREGVEQHLVALTKVFDATTPLVRSPAFFASDLTQSARPIAIDGTRDLIDRGLHREAVFWIVATYSRCMIVLHHDAPGEVRARFEPAYRDLVADIGISSTDDLEQLAARVLDFLPRLWETAESILAANQDIT